MKRSGFKKPTLEEVKEKQAKKRATGSYKMPQVKSKPKKRARLPTLKTLRNKADSKLTPLCKKTTPYCEGCGHETEVGHHWIEKSRSSFLRYDMRNLIALCHSCHAKIHNRFGNSVVGGFDVASKIVQQRGIEWKEQLDRDARIEVKVDRLYYLEAIDRLDSELNKP